MHHLYYVYDCTGALLGEAWACDNESAVASYPGAAYAVHTDY